MASFASNTLIGQITSPAIAQVGWRYFLLFVVCNFTNAIFFWALMPETKKRPLEEMNNLFSHTSWFVPTAKLPRQSDLDVRVQEIVTEKGAIGMVEVY